MSKGKLYIRKVLAKGIYRHVVLTLYMSLSVTVSLSQLTLMK